MAPLAEVLRLDRALWAQVYERQMRALRLGGFDNAQLEAALIADGALELAEEGTDESTATAQLVLRIVTELLLMMPPCQPTGALQFAIVGRLRGMKSQPETSERCAPQNDGPTIESLVQRLLAG